MPSFIDNLFSKLMILVAVGPGLYLVDSFIRDSWTRVLTPSLYAVLILGTYARAYSHTKDASYSGLLAFNVAPMAGYIYEIPRYISLGSALIRHNKYSVFMIDYSMISVIVVFYLLSLKSWKIKPIHLGLIMMYLAYFQGYLTNNPVLWGMRYSIGLVVFRIPSMLLMLSLPLGLKPLDK